GVPKISSFELARLLGQDASEGEKEDGTYVGTPTYMAPEQAAARRDAISPATDIHALGTILYQLLTGRPPFQGERPVDLDGEALLDLLDQIRSREPMPPSRLQADVPPALEAVCLKCLQKEPVSRYASAAALAQDLRRFLAWDSRSRRGSWF